MEKAFFNFVWENFPSTETPINDSNLMKINNGLDEVDNRILILDETKFDAVNAELLVKYIEYDENTGIFKITHYNNASYTIDTLLEKLAINFDYDYQTQKLIIELSDGEIKYVDLSALITQYEFLNSETVAFMIDGNGKVTAKIINGSIQEKHLRPDYLADIRVETAKAKSSAEIAGEKEKEASNSALMAKSYSDGNTGIREGEDTDNAKYYSKEAKKVLESLELSGNVVSVNGKSGVVVLTSSDVSAVSKSGDTMTGTLEVLNKGIEISTKGNGLFVTHSDSTDKENRIGLAVTSNGGLRGLTTPKGGFILSVDSNDKVLLRGTAIKAERDGNGNIIANTYAKLDLYDRMTEGSGYSPIIYRSIGTGKKQVLISINSATYLLASSANSNEEGIIIQSYNINNTDKFSVTPSSDNEIDLGSNGNRWKQLYAATSSIITSDKNEKKDIKDLEDKQTIDFIMGLKPKSYKFIDGESGRTHHGLISNEIEELLAKLGMSTLDFAGFIKTPKTRTVEREVEQEIEKDGEIFIKKSIVPEREIIEGEYTYGLRYEEFISPLIKMVQIQQKKLEELELKLNKTKV